MSLIEVIPIGKKYKETRDNLMYKAKIKDIRQFRKEITQLREQYTIIFDDGYYFPSSREEYMEFINKMEEQRDNVNKTIKLAYKEMEEMINV